MTRLEILKNTTFELVESIAAKLHNDGLTVAEYTTEKANAILAKTALPSKLIVINEEFEGVVKYHMAKFERMSNRLVRYDMSGRMHQIKK